MEVDEILGLNNYYHDLRFAPKKPNLRGTWQERTGDNFYSLDANGKWIQHRNRFHLDEFIKQKDTKHARVFIAHRFWYLGRSAAELPERFNPLVGGRGTRVNHNPKLVKDFRLWVITHFTCGVHDVPNDNPDINYK